MGGGEAGRAAGQAAGGRGDGAGTGNVGLRTPDLLAWLRETDEARLEALWTWADRVRHENVGDAVHLRGLIEVSNHCVRQCGYCGIRAGNRTVERYRMTADEVLECARMASALGYGTVVMQAGEDYGLTQAWVADVVRRIKGETGLAVTLSLGERPVADLAAWREAGADRYLMRFETSDAALYARIHPPRHGQTDDRWTLLKVLADLGYEVGSGIMVGIPGQTWDTLAADIETFRDLDLDMIGIGPFIPHPETPLGQAGDGPESSGTPAPGQVPSDELTVLKAVALTRIVRPDANLPSTTALATIDQRQGRELGLMRGANVVMPNLTPVRYRAKYEIYPGKACIGETAEQCAFCLAGRIRSIGRTIGTGPGGRK